ncbi:DUF1707 domain-containing protein [Streptomyces sp. S1A(2023)]
MLRVAAGDGRLTATELDERLDGALSARTLGELTALTTDLPSTSESAGAAVAEVKDVLRIEQKHSPVTRAGRWVVPRRLVLDVKWCAVTLDFTEAVITQDTLRIDVDMRGRTLTLITRPGIVVDADALSLEYSRVRIQHPPELGTPVSLRCGAGRREEARPRRRAVRAANVGTVASQAHVPRHPRLTLLSPLLVAFRCLAGLTRSIIDRPVQIRLGSSTWPGPRNSIRTPRCSRLLSCSGGAATKRHR